MDAEVIREVCFNENQEATDAQGRFLLVPDTVTPSGAVPASSLRLDGESQTGWVWIGPY